MRYRDIAAQHSVSEKTDSNSYLLQLERDTRAGMLILHILDKNTGKRTEVRGKMGYETNGYDPNDKLHQLLDKVGKSASVSDLMNGDVVSINPRHPDAKRAQSAADTAYDEDQHPNDTPRGPETKPAMPKGTVRVDVSDVYDWYKLGQHISNLKGLGKHDFGKGPPASIISFGSEEEEHKFIQYLKQLGLDITDIDPGKTKGVKSDPTYNVESNTFTDARMNAIKAGKKEFTVGGKTYKITGDTKDEEEAVAKISEETGKELLKIFKGMHHDVGMNKDMDRFILSHDWELKDFTPDMFPNEEEFFDYDDPFDRVIDIDYSTRVNLSAPIIVGPQFSDGKYSVIDGNHRAAAAQRMGKTIKGYFPVEKTNENFADGKNPGRKGLSKRMGVNTKASVSSLRKTAKNSSGEKQRMAHWLANMKAGRKKAAKK